VAALQTKTRRHKKAGVSNPAHAQMLLSIGC